MKHLNSAFSSIVMLSWGLYIYVDWRYQQTIIIAPVHDWPQSEMYGPLSHFIGVAKWLALVLTAALCVLCIERDFRRR
jgi:hypothetical protein